MKCRKTATNLQPPLPVRNERGEGGGRGAAENASSPRPSPPFGGGEGERVRACGHQAGSQRGVALVLTLIMLAVITVITVIFLATARRNRASTTVRIDQTTAEFAAPWRER